MFYELISFVIESLGEIYIQFIKIDYKIIYQNERNIASFSVRDNPKLSKKNHCKSNLLLSSIYLLFVVCCCAKYSSRNFKFNFAPIIVRAHCGTNLNAAYWWMMTTKKQNQEIEIKLHIDFQNELVISIWVLVVVISWKLVIIKNKPEGRVSRSRLFHLFFLNWQQLNAYMFPHPDKIYFLALPLLSNYSSWCAHTAV